MDIIVHDFQHESLGIKATGQLQYKLVAYTVIMIQYGLCRTSRNQSRFLHFVKEHLHIP